MVEDKTFIANGEILDLHRGLSWFLAATGGATFALITLLLIASVSLQAQQGMK
jgi:hypothetical protein